MGLIKCKECGKEVSEKAKHCVHCGTKLKSNTGIIILGIVAVFIVGIVVYGFWSDGNEETRQQEIIDEANGKLKESAKKIECIKKGMEYSSSQNKCVKKGWGD